MKRDLRRDDDPHRQMPLLSSERQHPLRQSLRSFCLGFPNFRQVLYNKRSDYQRLPGMQDERIYLVRLVENNGFPGVDVCAVEQLEDNLKQRTSGAGTDETERKTMLITIRRHRNGYHSRIHQVHDTQSAGNELFRRLRHRFISFYALNLSSGLLAEERFQQRQSQLETSPLQPVEIRFLDRFPESAKGVRAPEV